MKTNWSDIISRSFSLLDSIRKYRATYLSSSGWFRCRYHNSVAAPDKLITVPPSEINYLTIPQFHGELPVKKTHIVGGQWDTVAKDGELRLYCGFEKPDENRKSIPVQNYLFYQSIENHFRHQTPWEETKFYQWVTTTDSLPRSSLYVDERTRQWRFDQLDALASSMKTEAYRTQHKCKNDSAAVPSADRVMEEPGGNLPPEYDEVTVNIGKDGELIFEEGRHRFAVAKALNIESIPVRVFVRHKQWQEKRSEVARATHPSQLRVETQKLLSHPDMFDVIGEMVL